MHVHVAYVISPVFLCTMIHVEYILSLCCDGTTAALITHTRLLGDMV